MKLPFIEHLQRLAGPVTHQIEVTAPGPEGQASVRALRYLLDELPDLLLAAVVDVATGKTLATYTTDRHLLPAAVAGPNAEAVRQIQAGLRTQQPGETLEELLITLPSQLHLLGLVPDGRRYLYLAVDAQDTNLGIARTVMRGSLERLLAD